MKKFHVFYIIGSLGFAITALMHIVVSLTAGSASLAAWVPIYVTWLSFMCIGLPLTLRQTRASQSTGA